MNILPDSDYQKFAFESSLKIYRILCVFAIALYGLFIIQDHLSYPGTIYHALVMRFLVVIPVFCLFFGLTFTSLARRWLKYFASISLIAAEGGVCYLLAINKTPDAQFIYFGSTMLLLLVTHSIIWQGYLFNGVTSLLMIFFYSLTMYFYIEPTVPLLNQVELLLAAMVFGTTANYFIDLHLRNEYKIAKELTIQKNKAEKATQLKDKFVSLVSHDLRGPIGSMAGLMELAKTEMNEDGSYGGKLGKYLDISLKTCASLQDMINKLLDIGRLQTGNIVPKKRLFNVRGLASEILGEVSYLAADKGIRLVNKLPEKQNLFGDKDLIGQVVLNLLHNAIKFTKNGGVVTIYMHSSGVLAVKDTGVGINPAILPDIFKYEIKTSTEGTSGETGTGLGVPYGMEIMKLHGGDLRLETGNGGSVFFMDFPKEKPIVLVVDDQRVQRKLIKEQLSKVADVEVLEAENGKICMEILDKIFPALILTDIHMPEMDGLELIRRIRENYPPDILPIVVGTALSSNSPYKGKVIDIRSEALALGANDFITKPIIPEDFIPRIKRLIV